MQHGRLATVGGLSIGRAVAEICDPPGGRPPSGAKRLPGSRSFAGFDARLQAREDCLPADQRKRSVEWG